MNNNDVPHNILMKAAQSRSSGLFGFGDFVEPFIEGIRPATSMPQPPGPADFPVQTNAPVTDNDLLKRILAELIAMNTPARPVIRSLIANEDGQTLDWQAAGIMDRLVMINNGPDPLWYAFDVSGPAVNAFTGDQSFELLANTSINLERCQFYKIGVICASGKTSTVNAIAFRSVAGNQAASIS